METKNEQDNDSAISNLLGSLPPVSPPGDFDVRVRARIANGRPASDNWSWRPMFATAMSLCLVLAIGGFFAFRTTEPEIQAAVTLPQAVSDTVPVKFQASEPPIIPTAPTTNQDKIAVKPTTSDNRMVVPVRPIDSKPTSGSIDSAVSESVLKYPRGLGPSTRNITPPKDFEPSVQMTAKSILGQLGVDAEFTKSGWKVSAVKANSAAERVGLKAGDVVESINDRVVTEKTTFKGNFSGKNMRLVRDGQKLEVDLRKP